MGFLALVLELPAPRLGVVPCSALRGVLRLVCRYASSTWLQLPTGLASRFDSPNPHGFSGFCEAKFEQIGTGEGQRQPLLFVSIDQKAYLRPPCAKSAGSRPILTKIVVFPLGCPDTLVWGARAAKSPGTV